VASRANVWICCDEILLLLAEQNHTP
jgi:hypothetical protein